MESPPLWIDALCINQADHIEREEQVRLMSDIYANAETVLIWLGEDDTTNSCSKGIKFINELDLNEEAFRFNQAFGDQKPEVYIPLVASFDLTTRFRTSSAEWESLKQVMTRSWVSRLWTFQEIAKAQKAVILSGTSLALWPRFVLAVAIVSLYGHEVDQNLDISFMKEGLLSIARNNQYLMDSKATLLDMVTTTSSRLCSDIRDKIYGVVNLVGRLDARNLVNYNRTVSKVYEEATLFMIREESSLGVLQLNSAVKSLTGLLTWVPDWSQRSSRPPVYYKAAMSTLPRLTKCRDGELSPQGLTVDTIDRLYDFVNVREEELRSFVDGLPKEPYSVQGCKTHPSSTDSTYTINDLPRLQTHPKGVPWAEAFWRTWLFDRMAQGTTKAILRIPSAISVSKVIGERIQDI